METIAFVLLVVDGEVPFIATDIFLAFITLLDFFTIIHLSISDIFKITVELRNGPWSRDIRGSEKSNVAARLDVVFTGSLTICLMVGNGIRAGGWPGAWIGGCVLSYLVILSHILLAIPSIQKSSLTVTAKFTKLGGKKEPDTKTSVQPAARTAGSDIGSDAGSARRRAAENEQSRQPIEDLV